MGGIWEVVGGEEKGGVIVRTDGLADSTVGRLSTGAYVEELGREAQRGVRFRRLCGLGPQEGWLKESVLERPSNIWQVTGGRNKGGILVREKCETSSPALAERLSTGALVRELERQEDRLCFQRLTGTGPDSGWVSLRLQGGQALLEPLDFAKMQGQKKTSVYDGIDLEIQMFNEEKHFSYAQLPPWVPTAAAVARLWRQQKPFPPTRQTGEEREVKQLAPHKMLSLKQLEEMSKQRLPGCFYGLTFPQSSQEMASEDFGPAWLTKAFHTLEKWVVQEDGQEPDDLGSKILLKMPRILYVAVPVQALILAACLLFSDSLSNLQGQYYSSVISKFFYTIASAVCPYFLLTSLRSADLMLSVGKLNEFLADFNLHWSSVSGQRWRRYALMWMCLVLVEIATQALFILDGISGEHGAFHSGHVINWLCVVSFAICSSLVVVVAYTQCHLLAALDKSLDCWCFNIASDPDFDLGVLTWNRLQALLKCVGRSLASSFIAMQVLGAVGFVYSLASGIMVCFQFDFAADKILREVLSSLPLLFLFALNMTVCTTGASLTEKCRNIPALVNQLPSDICIDTDRQYLVNFLKDSAAGFCVKDIRLTREMLAKQFIIIGGVISGLFAALSRAI